VASLAVTLLSLLAAVAEEKPSAAEEGKKVVGAMLIVGLVFVGVIVLGQTFKWLGHRRHARRPRVY
jgi:Kef-type K+ transport system membrane component KefB